MKTGLFCAIVGVGVTGCATAPQTLPTVPTPVCISRPQCTAEWAAARTFVLDNAGYKIQIYSPDFLQTYNPGDESTSLAATVNKQPMAGGAYKIVGSFWCNNMFGCFPDPTVTLDQFNRAVEAAGAMDGRR